jgi:hypothetical protein
MATIPISWDNSAVNANVLATGQRVSKRIKALIGAFDTLGFAPVNDMAKTVNSAVSTILPNRVYEYKVEAICSSGGPIINNNGPRDGIVFECIVPTFITTSTTIDVVVDLLNKDITKIRVRLKKQSDNSLIGTITANKVGNNATANFTGLVGGTAYYVEIELYALVNGVEVISSAANYLNAVCGGNIAGYQVTTGATPTCPAPLNLVIGS